MDVLLSGFLFCLCYVLTSIACGLLTWFLDESAGNEVAGNKPPDDRQIFASFLLGTGFAPFVIGLVQAVFLIVLAGFPPVFYGVGLLLLAGASLYLARVRLARLAGVVSRFLRPRAWSLCGVALFLAIVLYITSIAASVAIRPLVYGDSLIYATEAKDIIAARSYTGRLGYTPTPNAQNHIRGNDHPITFITYLASGLSFHPDAGQDFGLRLAYQAINVTLFLVLAGLGLRISPWVALFAPLLLLYQHNMGGLLVSSARDSFRFIPMLMVLGFIGTAKESLRVTKPRGVLLFGSFAYLWNSHLGSIMVAPLLLFSMIPFVSGLKRKGAMALLFLAAFLLAGNQCLTAYIDTGSLMGHSESELHQTKIRKAHTWAPAPPPAKGLANVAKRFSNQFKSDGDVTTLSIFLAIAGVAFLALSRRRPPTLVLSAALFVLLFELIILGVFDFLNTRSLSIIHYQNVRYRFVVYPMAAISVGYLFWRLGQSGLKSWLRPVMFGACLLLLAGGVASSQASWGAPTVAAQIVRTEDVLSLLEKENVCWWELVKILRETGARSGATLSDCPTVAWYYTDKPVFIVSDPRVSSALMTRSPGQAVQILDALGIEYLFFNKVKLLSGTALDVAIESGAYVKIVDCPYEEIYIRDHRVNDLQKFRSGEN